MTKVLAPVNPVGFTAAYIISYLQNAENKRSFLRPIIDQMKRDDVVPWGYQHCYDRGVATLIGEVARYLGPRGKQVLGYSKVEGWFFLDEATAAEIVQGGSTRMRRGFKQASNALDDIDDSGLRPAMAGDLQALGELIDEYRDKL